ncbi:cell cycle checkpoint control protein RAD9A isoform X2 [Panthera tigris]|uniref:cell cycle checkpoint control protein RAD9A isoform X2 n=1 Tax=Panthera leo TaxID=9689 RepID=UPI001C69BAC3|nr:cell cycle checkpoint control protein RAD9A isoform X2 [Panthera leo]XP_042813900.1 cell cycle checkpoint control protein RAD9A isoform X2 [Panthera tigris]
MDLPHSVVPGRLPLAGDGGEDCGEMLHLAEWQEQPPGGPAALQIRGEEDSQPVLPGMRVPAGRLRPSLVLPCAPCPRTGPGGGCSALPPHIGRSDAGHRLWPQGHPAQLPGGRDRTVKAMVTEMSIGEEDFQQLQAREGVAITFCLKEFRGLLTFAESANLSLSIHFDVPGRPAIFAIKDSLLDGHFVLATMSESDLRSPERHRLAPPLQADSTPHLDDFANDDIDSYMIAMETTADIEGSRAVPSMSFSPGHQPPSSPGPYSEDNDTEPSIEPGTPPPKKFRSLFFGSVLAPARSPPGPSPVLAEDSEGEG